MRASFLLIAALTMMASTSFAIITPRASQAKAVHVNFSIPRSPGSLPNLGLARQAQAQRRNILVAVLDETGVAVPFARVILTQAGGAPISRCETDYSGQCQLAAPEVGLYQLRAEKEGFYATVLNDIRTSETTRLDVVLNHQQEIAESVNVYDSPPAIDPAKTEADETLTSREILNLPYPSTRDIRSALPLIPGVLQDASEQIHVNGVATYQIYDELDGFNITHPANGLFVMRVSADAVRSVEVQTSRYSTQYGKGSGGVLSLTTGMGDDRYRFSATNFIPSIQTRKGLNINEWTPRATFSGPLCKGRAWFYEAADGEYGLKIVEELPSGADRSPTWRWSNLAKAQVNLSERNILTGGFLFNDFHTKYAGLTPFNPLETTTDQRESAYLLTLKDQFYFSNGMSLQAGFGANQYRTDVQPLGSLPYIIRPEATSGNYFETMRGRARRLQGILNLTLPIVQLSGRHEFRVGADIDRINDNQSFARQPVSILRENGTLARRITFTDPASFNQNNSELSAYAQDRWSVSDRLLIEGGLRVDRDTIIRRLAISPRASFAYLLTRDGETKISAGAGLFSNATNLDFITRPLAGRRIDLFYAADGQMLAMPPVETSFEVDERSLKVPRALNWSVGLERKLPASIYMDLEFVERRERNGFAFFNRTVQQTGQTSQIFELQNARRDRYDGLQLTLRRTFRGGYAMLASYTRSRATSNAVIDFTLDNPVFSQQAGGPLPWDAPNKFIFWGWLPLIRKFDFAYSVEYHSGFPFSLVNENQQLVGEPNAHRFPDYFTLNAHVERRFQLLGLELALRAGFNNLTNRQNPTVVNNNVDSPQFLTFSGAQHRAFTARIRFLGRK